MRRQFFLLLIASLALLFSRCAQIADLTGGERDTTPPVLQQSTPLSGTTSFTAGEILLRFNEYIQLTDLPGQLIVSPRMTVAPEVSAEGKLVRIRLDKNSLKPNTTYRVDFGRAIADMNESNRMPALSYVFSTGPLIDSLNLTGSVKTASNNAPAPDIMVGLYFIEDTLTQNEKDSLPFLVAPLYTARTDAGGLSHFSNLPSETFVAFAVADANKNKLYDAGTERVAFNAEPLELTGDSSMQLRLFTEEPSRQFVRRAFSPAPGRATVIYNKRDNFRVASFDPADRDLLFELQPSATKDTISVLYRGASDTLALRIEYESTGKTDTVLIALAVSRPGAKKRMHGISLIGPSDRFDPSQPVFLQFQQWMDTTHLITSRLRLRSDDDSLIGSRSWNLSWHNVHTLALRGDWHRGSAYIVRADTGLAVGADGVASDSVVFSFRISGPEDVSKLTVNLLVDKKQTYLVQLLNEGGRVVASRAFAISLSSPNRVPLVFDGLIPGTYRLKVVYDDNANGEWDTGNVLKQVQPERVFMIAKEFKLLGDWEVEEEVQVIQESTGSSR